VRPPISGVDRSPAVAFDVWSDLPMASECYLTCIRRRLVLT
jgi:hypothetical protein